MSSFKNLSKYIFLNATKPKSASKCSKIISKKNCFRNFVDFLPEKWEYYNRIFPSSSSSFPVFWRKFAPQKQLEAILEEGLA
jgi:hypothetical protein